MQNRNRKEWIRNHRVHIFLQDILNGIRVVKAFGMEQYEMDRYDKITYQEAQISVKNERFFAIFHTVNLGLGIFNLIPIPPLDGSRILTAVLPPRLYFGIMKYERKIYLVLVVWMLLGGFVSRFLLSISFVAANPILSFVAGLFSLSGIISSIISALSGLIIDFWTLFPFLKL